MKENLIIILFIFISVTAYSAKDKRITWDPVAGAAGYALEIKDSQNNIIVDAALSENYYSVSHLNPGAYSFRIATLNILKQKGESTPWIDFVIEKLYIPELKSVSQRELISSSLNTKIIVRGKNLKPGGRLLLRGNGREIELTDVEIISDNEAVFSYKPDRSSKGRYDLVVINRGDAESVLKDAIEIVDIEDAGTICFIGAGYLINITTGRWSEYYPLSYTGADIFFQFSGRNMGLRNILFEVELDAVRYNNADSLRKSTYSYSTLGIGSGYYYPVAGNSLELFFKVQAGGVYTSISLNENSADKEITSIDFYTMAGAGARAYLSDNFFIDSTCGWKTIFYAGAFFNDIRVSLGCGRKF